MQDFILFREKKQVELSRATTSNAHLQGHTKLCITLGVYLLLLLVVVWTSLEVDTSLAINN
jgi:hypothetical protein